MIVLGFSGGPNAVHERGFELTVGSMHDAAAVLLKDGVVVAAIEQERLDRIKHSTKAPFDAMRFCLRQAGLRPADVDRLAFYGEEPFWDLLLRDYYLHHFEQPALVGARALLRFRLEEELGVPLAAGQPEFVPHHLAHGVSAAAMSGFDRSLVVTLDAQGDETSGAVFDARGAELETLATVPVGKSLGLFYLAVIQFLGFRLFDEYKVMGLAPYGDPLRFRDLFQRFYALAPDGQYSLDRTRVPALFEVCPPRRPWEEITQVHRDIAAALQRSLEDIVLHLLRHYRQKTGHRQLCLAGGVAHNCPLNGAILRSGLFDDVFVQPASHDAGCALGAALHVSAQAAGRRAPGPRLDHVYWGTDIGGAEEVEAALRPWQGFLEIERVEDASAAAAEMLARGMVLGWVQGRSEFGPRALGNRSIVADPRPAGNKDLINAMVKKREAFRPFAPSVLEERAHEFFDLPAGVSRLPFMVFTVDVRKDKRELLGAVTHADGSARIQTVSRLTNERYWRLIEAFGKLTGVPVILNTSFNNNAEPIVDSVRDAVVCFLTTGLHGLVVGDFVARKRDLPWTAYLALVPALPRHVALSETRRFRPAAGWSSSYGIASNAEGSRSRQLSAACFRLLSSVDGAAPLGELLAALGLPEDEQERLVGEVVELWSVRLLQLAPTGMR